MITNLTLAVIGTTELLLIGVPALVGLWLWQRGKRMPPPQGPEDRHTTLIDF